MWLLTAAVCALLLSLAGAFLYLDPSLPDAASYRSLRLQTPLHVYGANGELIAEYGERRMIPRPIDEIPLQFRQAVLAIEDKRFYDHHGIDPFTLIGTTLDLLLNRGRITRGGSTITMQVARNVSLSRDRTFLRKFREMLLALKIERELSKDEILELYVNLVPFGKRAYGAEAAAQTYYGKPLEDLDLAQYAMLAGIPQAPSAGNPVNGPDRALRRRSLVLRRMFEQDLIDQAAYEAALAAPLTERIVYRQPRVQAPFATELVRKALVERYGERVYTDGIDVFTTIDPVRQEAANRAVVEGLLAYDRRHGWRGPEARLPVGAADLPADEADRVATAGDEEPEPAEEEVEGGTPSLDDAGRVRAHWLAVLNRTRPLSGLQPAVVSTVGEREISVLRADGSEATVGWAGLQWARPWIDADRRGAAPRRAADVVAVGDLVRVADDREAGGLRLSQVPDIQAALVSIEPDDGAIVALVGGFDFDLLQFDHATQARRQPGSGLKPFIYAAGLNAGVTPASVFLDAPLVFEDAELEGTYRPRNSGDEFRGPVRLREALYRSINLVSMRLLLKIGPDAVLGYLPRFGFDTAAFPRDLQLAIGGGTIAVTPLEMARAYAVLANGGYRVTPHLIREVRYADGTPIDTWRWPQACPDCSAQQGHEPVVVATPAATTVDEPAPPVAAPDAVVAEAVVPVAVPALDALPPIPAEAVVDARIAYTMTSMLRDVIQLGTGRRARELGRTDIAGKTGTTNDADLWFNGYTRDLVTTVWVGFSSNRPVGDSEFGSTVPLPMWMAYMRTALADRPPVPLVEPNGIVQIRIDPATGAPAPPGAPRAVYEMFLRENAPVLDARVDTGGGSSPGEVIAPHEVF